MKSFARVAGALMLAAIVLVAGSVVASPKGYQEIDAVAVKEMMDQGRVTVVFPLSPIEYDHQHIKGSVNIPLEQLEGRLPDDKTSPLVFYCLGMKCVASWRAAEKAVDLGYQNVYAFRAGLPAWVEAGYPTESTAPLPNIDVDRISTRELSFLIESGEVVLLDINLDSDAHKFYIDYKNRVHLPLNELQDGLGQLPKDKQIVVHCLKGKRSPTACRYLRGKGFERVVMLDGGIQKWVVEGRPVKRER